MPITNKCQTELGGFVMNTQTGQYEVIFTSEIGTEILVRSRAKEKADLRNCLSGKPIYNIEDIVVKRRQTILIYGDWETLSCHKQNDTAS